MQDTILCIVMINEKFMKLAIEKAKEGISKGQKPFGACIAKDGKTLACSHNTEFETSDVTAHAEMNAIREACRKLNSLDLSGSIMYATYKPCEMCLNACKRAKIKQVFYGYREEGRKVENFDIEITSGVLSDESKELLKLYESYNK